MAKSKIVRRVGPKAIRSIPRTLVNVNDDELSVPDKLRVECDHRTLKMRFGETGRTVEYMFDIGANIHRDNTVRLRLARVKPKSKSQKVLLENGMYATEGMTTRGNKVMLELELDSALHLLTELAAYFREQATT